MSEPVRRWNTSTKRMVALIVLVLLALVLYRFRDVLLPLVIAFLLAFILDPIVDFLVDRLRFPRTVATTLVFLVLIAALLGILAAPVTAVPSVQRVVRSLQFDLDRVISETAAFFDRPLEVRGYSLDLSEVFRELSAALRSFVGRVAEGTLDIVFSVASGAFWLLFILMTTFYLLKDADRLVEQVDQLAPPGYRDDVVRLRQQITDVWNAFLRGQLVMGLLMIAITTVVCMVIGLPYAWALGLLAGVTEFIPSVGPIIAAIPAVLLALFQDSNFLALGNIWFAALVAGLYVVIQQIEGNVLLPRILGRSLNLHPVFVLIAIIVGGSMAGILGMLLAAPVLATLRVIGLYIFCRLYDRDPFADLEKEAPPPTPGLLKRARETAFRWLQERRKRQIKPPAKPP
jgi:predicted PurR-regulated permease PerM